MSGTAIGDTQVSRDMETIFGRADPFPSGETSGKSQAIKPIVSRCSTQPNGETLVLTGVVLAGALAVSLGLAQRGMPNPSPRQTAKPLAPVVSTAPVQRGPVLAETQAVPAT